MSANANVCFTLDCCNQGWAFSCPLIHRALLINSRFTFPPTNLPNFMVGCLPQTQGGFFSCSLLTAAFLPGHDVCYGGWKEY